MSCKAKIYFSFLMSVKKPTQIKDLTLNQTSTACPFAGISLMGIKSTESPYFANSLTITPFIRYMLPFLAENDIEETGRWMTRNNSRECSKWKKDTLRGIFSRKDGHGAIVSSSIEVLKVWGLTEVLKHKHINLLYQPLETKNKQNTLPTNHKDKTPWRTNQYTLKELEYSVTQLRHKGPYLI